MMGTMQLAAGDDGFDRAYGIVLALTSGFVLGSVTACASSARRPHPRFAVFAALAAAAALAHPLHVSVAAWLVLRFALGFCVAADARDRELDQRRATTQTRGRCWHYMVLFFLAARAAIHGCARRPGEYRCSWCGILIALSLVPVSLTASAPPEMEQADGLGLRTLWRRSELGLVGAATSGVVLGAFGTVGPVYAYEMGLPIEEVAAFMGMSILAAMALQWPVGYLSDRLPRRLVIIVIAGAAATAAMSTALLGHRSDLNLYIGVALLYGCVHLSAVPGADPRHVVEGANRASEFNDAARQRDRSGGWSRRSAGPHQPLRSFRPYVLLPVPRVLSCWASLPRA